ncbi:SDR family NAD(P)-dependent oxidoreductase [Parvularcula dongshanensis]|uniref:3-oxoacyl-[acyl-carrier protein] reductase n=1 Tax=Parvularcula dongshanensis TaxID=1173995 RepID=A0A840I5L6_9PROT|nr:SDR family NAD(P)-dependent oxidoreductase [Parvularcula dongshanensis]MBB4659571.1 3-oxoacyl-[acyl-carrier protein] reductase [Parvularcula dongshanensis]
MFEGRFAGRTAVVTGAGSGLGLAVAARIVAEGGKAVLWDLNADALEEAARSSGATATAALDVSDADAVERAAKDASETLGRIDILVNSAGITGATAPVHEFPVDSWRRVMAINLDGTFLCCRAILPFMLQGEYGRIVNVASVAGKEGNPNASAYSASKAGVIGLTKSLGKEYAGKGVIVNCITPATFDSPILDQLPQSQVDYMRSKIPMGRLGRVEESAAMACFMASEECSFTTGAAFDTSGGRTTF